MIEGDVVFGTLTSDTKTKLPIMAHPPNDTSDLSLADFLAQVLKYDTNENYNATYKGVKLDFKSIEALTSYLAFSNIKTYTDAFPIWINADIFNGPDNGVATVDAKAFFTAVKSVANTSLSLGWATGYNTTNPNITAYDSDQTKQMSDAITENDVSVPITFAVRAVYAAESIESLTGLLKIHDNSTLTIWSSDGDKVNVTNLRSLIFAVGLDKTFIDVPDDLLSQLNLDDTSGASLIKMSWVSLLTALVLFFRNVRYN
ncbi:hypothetical protein ABEB36_006002 [Hypothenemus hampei]